MAQPASMHVEIKGQFSGIGSHLPLCRCQELNSGCQAWQQVPLPAEPSHGPSTVDLKNSLLL